VSMCLGPVFILMCIVRAVFESKSLWGITAGIFLLFCGIHFFGVRCPRCWKSVAGYYNGGKWSEWITMKHDPTYEKPECPFCGFDLMTKWNERKG
jgi:hypothetical protein